MQRRIFCSCFPAALSRDYWLKVEEVQKLAEKVEPQLQVGQLSPPPFATQHQAQGRQRAAFVKSCIVGISESNHLSKLFSNRTQLHQDYGSAHFSQCAAEP
jgi:hypothetical protein